MSSFSTTLTQENETITIVDIRLQEYIQPYKLYKHKTRHILFVKIIISIIIFFEILLSMHNTMISF